MLHIHSHESWEKSCCLIIANCIPPPSPLPLSTCSAQISRGKGTWPTPRSSLSPREAQSGDLWRAELKESFTTLGKGFLYCNPPLQMPSSEPKWNKEFASNALNPDAQGSQVAQPSHCTSHILKLSSVWISKDCLSRKSSFSFSFYARRIFSLLLTWPLYLPIVCNARGNLHASPKTRK